MKTRTPRSFCVPLPAKNLKKQKISLNLLSKKELDTAVTVYTEIADSPFGKMCFGQIDNQICYGVFLRDLSLRNINEEIGKIWSNSTILSLESKQNSIMERFLEQSELSLRVYGSPFQLNVWQQLLTIQPGEVLSYQGLAERLGLPRAVRAVASAVGANRIAYLIPCHRVIRSDGTLGGFRWGISQKKAILDWENTVMDRYVKESSETNYSLSCR